LERVGSDLRGTRARLTGAFALVSEAQLKPYEATLCEPLREDPDFFGILRPLVAGRTSKTVSRECGRLIQAIVRECRIPADCSVEAARLAIRLVLDGVIEVETRSGYRSGVRYANDSCLARSSRATVGQTAQLSMDALRYGARLLVDDSRVLSARLYFFNRLPCSRELRRRFPDRASVREFLELGKSGPLQRLITQNWEQVSGDEYHRATWLEWRARHARGSRPRYKLYVSAHYGDLPWVFGIVMHVVTMHRALKVKIGADVFGLLRPDKLIVYFDDPEQLRRTAAALRGELAAAVPHTVPFSAQIDEIGTLSWGVDPDADNVLIPGVGRESWRLWLTNQLAGALLDYRAECTGDLTIQAWEYATLKLELEGVDTSTWAPATIEAPEEYLDV
jgi:hypothetical protein